jgi:isopentenyl phosphate kinase
VVKLGGSVITEKGVARTYRAAVVKRLAKAIAAAGLQVVVVHGGGSFGHSVAKKFGLSSRKSVPSPKGVSETRRAMFELNMKVCASLSSAGLHPYTISPFYAMTRESAVFMERLLLGGATPVTFGDVVHDGGGFRVLSGDTICAELSTLLKPARCVMAMDVDGALDSKGKVIPVLDDKSLRKLEFGRAADVTGGILFKLEEAVRMAYAGTEVDLVSGLRPAEFSKALSGLDFYGTRVRLPPRGQRG